jgi:hypothetical protein
MARSKKEQEAAQGKPRRKEEQGKNSQGKYRKAGTKKRVESLL